jgi:hypothetical protein
MRSGGTGPTSACATSSVDSIFDSGWFSASTARSSLRSTTSEASSR